MVRAIDYRPMSHERMGIALIIFSVMIALAALGRSANVGGSDASGNVHACHPLHPRRRGAI